MGATVLIGHSRKDLVVDISCAVEAAWLERWSPSRVERARRSSVKITMYYEHRGAGSKEE